MGAKKQSTQWRCHSCGTLLTEENSRYEGVPFCLECESRQYSDFEVNNGSHLALFFTCMKFDVPLLPLLVTNEFEKQKNKWIAYIEILNKANKLWKGDKPTTFNDGETNLFRIFGKNMSEKDFSTFCKLEKQRLESIQGTQRQREVWGERPLWQGLPLTTEIYNELDSAYERMASRYKGVAIDNLMEDNIRRVVKLRVVQDYVQSIGDAVGLDKVQKSIESILSSEQLRKRDEKPVEKLRIDDMVVALEAAGLMENGQLLTYDELVVALRDKFIKSKKYDYSLDVADQVILAQINAMKANADEPSLMGLPEEFTTEDAYGEFEPKETEQERENKRYIGVTKVQKMHVGIKQGDDK